MSFRSLQTNKITLSNEDLITLINSHDSYINDICQITGRSYNQVMMDFAKYHNIKELLIQPNGLSGIMHKLINNDFISSIAVQSAFSISASHVSGVSDMLLFASISSLIITVFLIDGIFFAFLEQLTVNIRAQPVLGLARDVCLIVPKITEIMYNQIFIKPSLRKCGIDAPLNVTSMLKFKSAMLKFKSGTKRIMGAVLNTTLSAIANATTNLKSP